MSLHRLTKFLPFLVLSLALFVFAGSGPAQANLSTGIAGGPQKTYLPLSLKRAGLQRIFLPLVLNRYRPITRYGIESTPSAFNNAQIRARSTELGASWLRLSGLSWRRVQPTPDSPYNFGALTEFNEALFQASRVGMIPTVVIVDSPTWATGTPSTCGAVRAEYFDEFAAFIRAAVDYYTRPSEANGGRAYNVRYWEIGNEPDVDPTLVDATSIYGCWGDISLPNYGGEHYGEMLKVVTPAIRAADPSARVLIGGLLLSDPVSPDVPRFGRPENFLRGILASGAAPFFDIVAYHAHGHAPSDALTDFDLYENSWSDLGGRVVGKARFLRQVMADFGVDKPLFLNEASYRCPVEYRHCDTVSGGFFQSQTDYLVRTYVRGAAERLDQIAWYTLEGPGWQNSGLLDESQNPRPAFRAYQQLIRHTLVSTAPPTPIGYGAGLEAYRFNVPGRVVDVVWSLDRDADSITFPGDRLVAAYSRDGVPLTPEYVGGDVRFNVGFSPIYIQRLP